MTSLQTSAVPVKPFCVLRRQTPLGRLTVPRAMAGEIDSGTLTSPRSL